MSLPNDGLYSVRDCLASDTPVLMHGALALMHGAQSTGVIALLTGDPGKDEGIELLMALIARELNSSGKPDPTDASMRRDFVRRLASYDEDVVARLLELETDEELCAMSAIASGRVRELIQREIRRQE